VGESEPRDTDEGIEYDVGMDRGVSRIIVAIGRALLGAFAGFFCALVATLLTDHCFGVGFLENLAKGDRLLVLGALTASGAIVAVVFGAREIRRRIGTALKGMAWGTVVGLLAGTTVAFVLGSTSQSPEALAAGQAMSIFMGVYIGAIIGGVIGGTATIKPEKKSPSWPASGVHDRELDG
jgi:hypothetical protein